MNQSLFDLNTNLNEIRVSDEIKASLDNYEPRVKVLSIEANDPDGYNQDNNKLNIQILFELVNEPNTVQDVDIMLERVR